MFKHFFKHLLCISQRSISSSVLPSTSSLVKGCDYEHWLVVMNPPKGCYPHRDELINGYIKTLALALGSEEEAKLSIYSVSTKYYYAFGCKVNEKLVHKIKSLPNVRWVLPDSYLNDVDNDYGGQRRWNSNLPCSQTVPYYFQHFSYAFLSSDQLQLISRLKTICGRLQTKSGVTGDAITPHLATWSARDSTSKVEPATRNGPFAAVNQSHRDGYCRRRSGEIEL